MHDIDFIYWRNYKGFEDGDIFLSKINVLLGANNSGKSSLLSLFLLLSQSFDESVDSDEPLLLNGPLVELGERKNIFLDHDPRNQVTIGFGLGDLKGQVKYILDWYADELAQTSQIFEDIAYRYLHFGRAGSRRNYAKAQLFMRWEKLRKARYGGDFEAGDSIQKCKSEVSRIEAYRRLVNEVMAFNRAYGEVDEVPSNLRSYYRTNAWFRAHLYAGFERGELVSLRGRFQRILDFIELLSEQPDEIYVEYQFALVKGAVEPKIRVNQFNVRTEPGSDSENGSKLLFGLGYRYAGSQDFSIRSDVLSDTTRRAFQRDVTCWDSSLLDVMGPIVGIRSHRGSRTLEDMLFKRLCGRLVRVVRNAFSNSIYHVRPIRKAPTRYYLNNSYRTGAHARIVDGDSLVEALLRSQSGSNELNEFLSGFGLSIYVDDSKEGIRSIRVVHNGIEHAITDVGFGLSQVLPVITKAVTSGGGELTLVEQPELHLHPKMQSELASLFAGVIKRNASSFILETHSDMMLTRFQKLIADNELAIDDLKVYSISMAESKCGKRMRSQIREMEISEFGEIAMPSDFYATEIEDSVGFYMSMLSGHQPTLSDDEKESS